MRRCWCCTHHQGGSNPWARRLGRLLDLLGSPKSKGCHLGCQSPSKHCHPCQIHWRRSLGTRWLRHRRRVLGSSLLHPIAWQGPLPAQMPVEASWIGWSLQGAGPTLQTRRTKSLQGERVVSCLGSSVEGGKVLCKSRWGNISMFECTKKGKTCVFPFRLLHRATNVIWLTSPSACAWHEHRDDVDDVRRTWRFH